MFDRSNAIDAFTASAGTDPRALPVGQAFAAMFDFFAGVAPQASVPANEDGDMLLFEYGSYDWGNGAAFELCLTRQVIWEPEEDEIEIWQLRLVYRYDPTLVGDALGKGLRWCRSRDELPEFCEAVTASPALRAVAAMEPGNSALYWEQQ
jgi:hypothetical protein